MDAKRSLVLLAMLAHFVASAAQWTTDYAAGLASARQQNRAVFLFFTGSDWCGWCQKLDAEVLSTPEFGTFANENLVLVKIDFPRRSPLPAAQAAQNDALAQQFNIQGFPTVLILNGGGKILGQTGYIPGGPAAFIQQLRQFDGGNWKSGTAAQPAGPSARPSTPSTPAPLFNGAPLRAPKKFDRVQLNGIMGTKQRPMIMVNNQTLTPGESLRLDIGDRRVKVTCKEIRAKSALLLIEGQSAPVEVFLEGN
jgi:thioredoxin-related protein